MQMVRFKGFFTQILPYFNGYVCAQKVPFSLFFARRYREGRVILKSRERGVARLKAALLSR